MSGQPLYPLTTMGIKPGLHDEKRAHYQLHHPDTPVVLRGLSVNVFLFAAVFESLHLYSVIRAFFLQESVSVGMYSRYLNLCNLVFSF